MQVVTRGKGHLWLPRLTKGLRNQGARAPGWLLPACLHSQGSRPLIQGASRGKLMLGMLPFDSSCLKTWGTKWAAPTAQQRAFAGKALHQDRYEPSLCNTGGTAQPQLRILLGESHLQLVAGTREHSPGRAGPKIVVMG